MATTRPLEDAEIQKIFRYITGVYAKRNETLLVVGIGLVLRATELISLTVGDVVSGNGEIKTYVKIRGETSKYGKERTVRIGVEIQQSVDLFLAWKLERGESLFPNAPLFASRKHGQHLTRQALFHLIKKILSAASIDQSPHCLRKTGGTLYYIESNFDLIATQHFLGHSDPSTTREYIGLTSEQLVEYSEKLSHRLFRAILKGNISERSDLSDGVASFSEFNSLPNMTNSDAKNPSDAELILALEARGYDVTDLLEQRLSLHKAPSVKESAQIIPISALLTR